MTVYLGKSQPPNPEHPLGVAVCGTPITPGLVVWTNEMETGKVLEPQQRYGTFDGWFDVQYANGRKVLQNWERVATVFEGRKAVDEWKGNGS